VSRASATPQTVRVAPPLDGTPPLFAACGIALAVVAHTKTKTWASFADQWRVQGDRVLKGLVLTDEDRVLMSQYSWAVARCGISPKSTPMRCERCGRVCFSSSSSAAKCFLTDGCEGRMVAATKASIVRCEDEGKDSP